MDEMTLSHLADMIIVFGGCGALCGVIGSVIAEGIWMLMETIRERRAKWKEKKHDQDAVSGS